MLILRLCQQHKVMEEGQKKTGVQGFFSPPLVQLKGIKEADIPLLPLFFLINTSLTQLPGPPDPVRVPSLGTSGH